MSRPLVSVVFATYQRAHLLARSLDGYERSAGIVPIKDLEIICVDDGSTDGTGYLVRDWSQRTGIRATVLTPHPKRDEWRDCGAVINHGIRASSGHNVIITHPEVIPGRRSVAECLNRLNQDHGYAFKFGLYVSCPVYYLSPRDQERIDTVDLKGKGVLAVREIEQFYDEGLDEPDYRGNRDYSHRATDLVGQPGSPVYSWESWVFGGCSRLTWQKLGGMLETEKWGSVDIAFHARRKTLGMPNFTCPDPQCIVAHQNHDSLGNVPTPRDMKVWMKELQSVPLDNPSKMCWPAIDHLGWGD